MINLSILLYNLIVHECKRLRNVQLTPLHEAPKYIAKATMKVIIFIVCWVEFSYIQNFCCLWKRTSSKRIIASALKLRWLTVEQWQFIVDFQYVARALCFIPLDEISCTSEKNISQSVIVVVRRYSCQKSMNTTALFKVCWMFFLSQSANRIGNTQLHRLYKSLISKYRTCVSFVLKIINSYNGFTSRSFKRVFA